MIRLGLVSNRGMIVMLAGFGAASQIFPDRLVANFFKTTGAAAVRLRQPSSWAG